MYNLIEYSNNYSKTSGSSGNVAEINQLIEDSELFIFKVKITRKTPADGNTKNVAMAVPLKYFKNFLRTPEVPLINCKINSILSWSEDCVISSATGKTDFAIIYTKLYFPVLILSLKIMQNFLDNWNLILNK